MDFFSPQQFTPTHSSVFPLTTSCSFLFYHCLQLEVCYSPTRQTQEKEKKKRKKEREKKQTENNNKPTNLIFSSTGSQPFTNIFLPRPTPNDPILKLTTEKKYCIYLKIQWRGSPPWGLKVQRIAWNFARPCCPQRVNSGQVTMLS